VDHAAFSSNQEKAPPTLPDVEADLEDIATSAQMCRKMFAERLIASFSSFSGDQSSSRLRLLCMPLTYAPFKQTPAIETLRHDLLMNVGPGERSFSAILGAGLVGVGLTHFGWRRWFFFLLGGALLKRGITGHCEIYQRLQIDTRHSTKSPGVESGKGTKIEHSVDIHCPAQELYLFWRKLDQLPRVFRHVEAVKAMDGIRSHWTVKGPLGQQFEWAAKIINDQENRLIAWETLPGATVPNAGSVWFEEMNNRTTRVRVALEFESPAKAIGLTIVELLGDSPQRELEDDLAAFKDFAERELTPASKSQN
jgi:uncharacterized membrane protein